MTGNRTTGSQEVKNGGTYVSVASVGASLGLVVLVVSVFVAANSMSAEASLRRFILAVNHSDAAGVRQNLWEAPDAPVSGTAISLARFTGTEYEITNRQERPDALLLVVTGHRPGTPPTYVAFVLSRTNGRWKVNATETHRVTQSMQFGG